MKGTGVTGTEETEKNANDESRTSVITRFVSNSDFIDILEFEFGNHVLAFHVDGALVVDNVAEWLLPLLTKHVEDASLLHGRALESIASIRYHRMYCTSVHYSPWEWRTSAQANRGRSKGCRRQSGARETLLAAQRRQEGGSRSTSWPHREKSVHECDGGSKERE